MSAAGPSQGAHCTPAGGSAAASAASVGAHFCAAGPSQGGHCFPLGGQRAARRGSSTTAALRVWLLAALVAFSHCVHAQVAPTPADWTEIKRVIAAQRDALVGGDGERAFSFAAPSIRSHFGDVTTFMRMVRESYRALLDARYVEFLEGAVIAGDVVQPLRLVLPDGTVLVAIYGVQRQADGGWRITACVIAPSTLRSA